MTTEQKMEVIMDWAEKNLAMMPVLLLTVRILKEAGIKRKEGVDILFELVLDNINQKQLMDKPKS